MGFFNPFSKRFCICNTSFLACHSLTHIIFYLPLRFFPYYPIHSNAEPDWILISLYQCAKEKRETAVYCCTPKETRIRVHKMELLQMCPGWKKLLFLFTIPYLMVGQVYKCWCQYSVTAGSDHCCKKPRSSNVTPSSLHQVSAAALEVFHLFQTII